MLIFTEYRLVYSTPSKNIPNTRIESGFTSGPAKSCFDLDLLQGETFFSLAYKPNEVLVIPLQHLLVTHTISNQTAVQSLAKKNPLLSSWNLYLRATSGVCLPCMCHEFLQPLSISWYRVCNEKHGMWVNPDSINAETNEIKKGTRTNSQYFYLAESLERSAPEPPKLSKNSI